MLVWLLSNIGIVRVTVVTRLWMSLACAMGLVSGSFAVTIALMVGTPLVDAPLVEGGMSEL